MTRPLTRAHPHLRPVVNDQTRPTREQTRVGYVLAFLLCCLAGQGIGYGLEQVLPWRILLAAYVACAALGAGALVFGLAILVKLAWARIATRLRSRVGSW